MSSQGQPTPPSSTSSPNGASPDATSQQHHHSGNGSGSSSAANNNAFRVVRKRNRVPLSCAPCRHRKLKCNRGHPCDNCTKRGDTAACSYATPGSRKRGSAASGVTGGVSAANASPDDMQNRIDRLEGLVLTLMTGGANVGPGGGGGGGGAAAAAAAVAGRSESVSTYSETKMDTPPIEMITEEGEGDEESEVDNLSRGIGIMKMDGTKAIFASDAHWYAILGEISEVKKYFEGHKEDYRQQIARVAASKAMEESSGGSSGLLGSAPTKSKPELLAAYPPKADADRLIARYFNAYDPSVHIIHGPSFQKQYDKHWVTPQETSVVWLGLNFAMMTLALQSYDRAGDEPPEYRGRSLPLSHEYRKLTAQALQLADITSTIPQILETLVLHMQAEYGRSRDAEPSVLLLTSLCVRLAMRMGYHRDPAPYPAITPFQGEIRRRIWTFIRGFDSLISFQFGLPAMIRTDHMDTQLPRNLYDDELHEDMTALPPSRPTFEATPMSYMITKSKMTFLFGRIVERSQSVTNPPTYEETMRADTELRETRAQHPPLLQMRPFSASARDPANLIMQRLGLEMMFLRSLFVLHRRFIVRGRESAKYAYSRRACLDASMELLSHQATLHQESQPGGRLRSVKWYISSLTTHDFLLAAMLICSDLHHTAESERSGRGFRHASSSVSKANSPDAMTNTSSSAASPLSNTSSSAAAASVPELYDPGKREEMLRAVEHCITIWETVRDSSIEAYKGSAALRVIVEKLRLHQERQQQLQQQQQQQQQFQQSQQQQPQQQNFGPRASSGFMTGTNGNSAASFSSSSVSPSASSAGASSASGPNLAGFSFPMQSQSSSHANLLTQRHHAASQRNGAGGPYGVFPNGQIHGVGGANGHGNDNSAAAATDPKLLDDHLAPEQSAAMTLGLLSSGALSPGPGFSAGAAASPNGGSGFPASMAALLNDPMPATANGENGGGNSGGAGAGQPSGALSPLSQLFGTAITPGGTGGGFMGMEGLTGDIDWVSLAFFLIFSSPSFCGFGSLTFSLMIQTAWDSYIQGTGNTGLDAAGMWPMNFDLAMDGVQQSGVAGGGTSPPGGNGNVNGGSNGSGGVFMGAPGGGMM